MKPFESKMRDIWALYKELLYQIPQSNINSLYYLYSDDDLPLNFGQSQYRLSLYFVEKLRNIGVVCRLVCNDKGTAIIVEDCGSHYYFDFSAYHVEKINLSEIDNAGLTDFKAFPVRDSLSEGRLFSKLCLDYNSIEGLLIKDYFSYSNEKGEYISNCSNQFTFCNFPCSESACTESDLLIKADLKYLFLRVLCASDSKIYTLLYPISYRDKNSRKDCLQLVLNDGKIVTNKDLEFRFFIGKIASNLGVSKEELFNFIFKGVSLYENYSPVGIL